MKRNHLLTLTLVIFIFVLAFSLLSSHPGTAEPKGGKSRGDPAKGKVLFLRNCAECHGDTAEGRKKEEAPTIGGNDFLVIATDRFLTNVIMKGRPGTKMKGFEGKLKDEEVKDVMAFLRSFQKGASVPLSEKPLTGGDSARGKMIFEANCIECHGEKGEGKKGPALNNKNFLADAPDTFLYLTIAGGRKGTPMDPMLKENGGKLSQKDIHDVIAFIRKWGSYAAASPKK